jgi:alkanesulfonate monooxygenase SsuD/methylene tetrahydromethanopterin reductase-like flavin-dependent oxidoreductase (luciferase family)
MVPVITDDPAEVTKVEQAYMKRMGADATKARDTVLGGTEDQVKAKLERLSNAGVGTLFIPTMLLPPDRHRALDRFLAVAR